MVLSNIPKSQRLAAHCTILDRGKLQLETSLKKMCRYPCFWFWNGLVSSHSLATKDSRQSFSWSTFSTAYLAHNGLEVTMLAEVWRISKFSVKSETKKSKEDSGWENTSGTIWVLVCKEAQLALKCVNQYQMSLVLEFSWFERKIQM